MATEAEIEAACRAFHPRETPSGIKIMGWARWVDVVATYGDPFYGRVEVEPY